MCCFYCWVKVCVELCVCESALPGLFLEVFFFRRSCSRLHFCGTNLWCRIIFLLDFKKVIIWCFNNYYNSACFGWSIILCKVILWNDSKAKNNSWLRWMHSRQPWINYYKILSQYWIRLLCVCVCCISY